MLQPLVDQRPGGYQRIAQCFAFGLDDGGFERPQRFLGAFAVFEIVVEQRQSRVVVVAQGMPLAGLPKRDTEFSFGNGMVCGGGR